jgi:GNAT superfamily N-acetyltransferase
MLTLSRPLVRRAERGERKELSHVIAAALAPFCGVIPHALLDIYVDHSRDVAGRWEACDVLVVEAADGRIAGTVSYVGPTRGGESSLPAGWATLRSLMVHPRAHGQGHGRRLVEYCIAAARNDGAPTIGLHTAAFMTAAQHLYHAAGFRRSPGHDLSASTVMGSDPSTGDVDLLAYQLDL